MNLARVIHRLKRRSFFLAICGLISAASPAHAQLVRDSLVYPLPHLSGLDAQELRVQQLEGRASTEGFLLRSPSSLAAPLQSGPGLRWQLLAPELVTAYNSQIPLSMNDGSMWAGRGTTIGVTAGIRARSGPFVLVLAPQWTRVANRPFSFPPIEKLDRSPMQASWRFGVHSTDLPVRFGTVPYSQFDLGQSFVGVETPQVVAGFTAENEWWGPGVRNSLVLSDNAQGIPRLTARTGEPIHTRIGDFAVRWQTGILTESLHFDANGKNDIRSFNAVGATFQPRIEPNLTLGATRAIVGRLSHGRSSVLPEVWSILSLPSGNRRVDLQSLFARWVFPRDGFEVYGEWLHQAAPEDTTAVRVDGERSSGYTLGLGWARPLSSDSAWTIHLSAEVTDVENRTPRDPGIGGTYLYVNPSVVQGYTQRGQSIGAAIGPGSSSQWVGIDLFLPRGQIGAGVERVRWDTNGFYAQLTGWSFIAHDVSVIPGVRAALRLGRSLVGLEVAREARMNFLFQNWATNFTDTNRIDHTNLSGRLFVRLAP
jgi:hypothetical protein